MLHPREGQRDSFHDTHHNDDHEDDHSNHKAGAGPAEEAWRQELESRFANVYALVRATEKQRSL